MKDQINQLRNDKIKLMAEVEVLTKQLHRFEENEKQAILKQQSIKASISTIENIAQAQNSADGCGCHKGQDRAHQPSERSIDAQIDLAMSSKFESYSNILENKITNILQGELKKFIHLQQTAATSSINNRKQAAIYDDFDGMT